MIEARSGAPWLWLSAATLAADRATKYLIETRTADTFRFVVVPQIVTIVHGQNPGIAFGVLSDSPSKWVKVALVIGATIVLSLLVWLLVSGRAGGGLARAGGALMVADSALSVGAALILIELLFAGREPRRARV